MRSLRLLPILLPLLILPLLLSGCSEGPSGQQVRLTLTSTVFSIDFEDTPFEDVMALVTRETGVPIRIEIPEMDAASADEWLVTLCADNITAANVLELVCLTKGVRWTIDSGVVVVGPPGHPSLLVLDLYDVKDMTVPIQSFPGDKWSRLGGEDPFAEWEEDPEPRFRFEGDALAELIRDTIDVDVWTSGGDVTYREGGILLVKAPQRTHGRIQRLLNLLRVVAVK